MATPKNVVLCIDGTWNEAADKASGENTNVHKLFVAADGHPDQVCQHLNGIGTDRLGRWVRRLPNVPRNIVGGLFGVGLSDRIKDAYQFLSANYVNGDNVYLFGFSRGAFAARSVAGFVDAVGLLLAKVAHDENLIEQAYAKYENSEDAQHSALRQYLRELGFAERPSADDGTVLPIYLLGVWDTVAALGLTGRLARFSAPFTEFHATELPSNVAYARHALATHELRAKFPALLWNGQRGNGQRPRLQQMWFPGAHSDVGGGYAESSWSDVALDWMATEALALGLRLRDLPRPATATGPTTMIHNSIARWFARATPTLRSPLSNPFAVDSDTRSTFDVHSAGVQRLHVDELTAYVFSRPAVNKGLRSADVATIRLLGSLGVVSPDATRVAAITNFWNEDGWNASSCRDDVSAFVNGAGSPAESESRAFVRAVFVQAVCQRDPLPSLEAAIDAAVRDALLAFTTLPDSRAPIGLYARLSEIITRVENISVMLPDAITPRVKSFVGVVQSARESLSAGITREQIKRGLPERMVVGPPFRLK